MREFRIFNTRFAKTDMWIFLSILPYHMLINYLLLGNRYFSEFDVAAGATLVSFFIWPLSWYSHTIAGFFIRDRFPEFRQTGIRVTLSLIVFVLVTLIQNTAIISLYSYTHLFGYQFTSASAERVYLAGMDMNIIATGFFETSYLVSKWKNYIIETEELKKAQIQSELDNLKNQVNPHFLFNSINSLSSLISEDAVRAEKFLSEMSKVYRYLLQNNDQEVTPLRIELEFINSYYHLLKTRYEDGIDMNVSVDEKYHQYLLPPLTLQMLIENAVKHNVILDKSPLQIRLTMDENHHHLIVQNNIQKKTTAIESSKIGLKNIKAKYKLLNQDDVTIEEKDNKFTVAIPLIKNN